MTCLLLSLGHKRCYLRVALSGRRFFKKSYTSDVNASRIVED